MPTAAIFLKLLRAAQVARTAPGQISTLIIPADCAWDESVAPVAALPVPARASVDDESIKTAAEWLKSGKTTYILMSNQALCEEGLALASQINNATGARILCDTFTPIVARGEGRCDIERSGYFAEQAPFSLRSRAVNSCWNQGPGGVLCLPW